MNTNTRGDDGGSRARGKMVVTERAVAKHTANIFIKLGLEVSDDDNRRVPAVPAHLDGDR